MHDLKANAKLVDIWIGDHQTSDWPEELERIISRNLFQEAQKEISTWPNYHPTMLRQLRTLASIANVSEVYYKDESTRFDLGSFKALGGAFAVLKYLSEKIKQKTKKPVSIKEIREGSIASFVKEITVVTATDGNHGRSVAWGAKLAGCNCKIYIHKEVSKGREKAMADLGADVIRIDGDYDESVRQCAQEADQNGWQVISDTSYEGYEDIPKLVMAGYSLIVREILDEMKHPPTHVIIQAGVGGLAAAVCAAFWMELGKNRPRFIVCESTHSDCILQSLKNGKASNVFIEEETIMAGLSCGEISKIAWDILSKGASASVTLTDDQVGPIMRFMVSQNIEAGECAVPGIISLLAISNNSGQMKQLNLNQSSRVLVFGCEGATDQQVYDEIINGSDGS